MGENFEAAYAFLGASEVTAPCLLDSDQLLYQGYPRDVDFAPFPMQVLIDEEGVIRYLGEAYNPDALRGAMEEVLGG